MTVHRIKVVCDEPSHAGKVATVCQFVRGRALATDTDPERVEWRMQSRITPRGRRQTKPLHAYDAGQSGARTVSLTADGRLVGGARYIVEADHAKKAIQCPLCLAMGHRDGPNVQVREDRLQRVLDQLADDRADRATDGVLRVTLSDLAAKVS